MRNLVERRGFTLSELLLAAAILVFVISGLLALFINCLFLNEASRNFTIAASHAQFAMEEVKSTNFSSIANATWDSAAISVKGLAPLSNETIVTLVTGTGPLDVLVTVNWRDRGARERSMFLETLIAEP